MNFIKNFTVGSLPAFRRAARDRPSSVELCADQTQICVTEVTSKSFRKIVLNNNKVFVGIYLKTRVLYDMFITLSGTLCVALDEPFHSS